MRFAHLQSGLAVIAVLIPILQFLSPPAIAADLVVNAEETREFEIFVDGVSSGTSTVSIREYEGGRVVASTVANVKVPTLALTYVYQFSGSEEWVDGRFARMQSRTKDGFSKFALQADADRNGTSIRVNEQKQSRGGAFALTTNYWQLPVLEPNDEKILALDAGTGKTYKVQLKRVGTEQYTFRGRALKCTHYQATGEQDVDLWFDGNGRLVRQSGLEDGHKTELRLTGYKRTAGK